MRSQMSHKNSRPVCGSFYGFIELWLIRCNSIQKRKRNGKEGEKEREPRPKGRRMKNRGVDGRINRKHGRVSAFSTMGHDTGLPGVCERTLEPAIPLRPSKFGSREFAVSLVRTHSTRRAATRLARNSRPSIARPLNWPTSAPRVSHFRRVNFLPLPDGESSRRIYSFSNFNSRKASRARLDRVNEPRSPGGSS